MMNLNLIGNLTEFDILCYSGEVKQNYLQFLSNMGKLIDITNSVNGNIYCGGLDRSGNTGKYSLYYQDRLYQVTYYTIYKLTDNIPCYQFSHKRDKRRSK